MLSSTTVYHAKVRHGKYIGYTVKIQQLCHFLWVIPFWDTIRHKDLITAKQVGEYIVHVEARFGKMNVVDNTNTILI